MVAVACRGLEEMQIRLRRKKQLHRCISDNLVYRGFRLGQVKVGEVYNNNFVVVRKLGWGHFSTVWCAWDRKNKRQVALKVQKSASHYTEAAMDEIDFLNKAASIDHAGSQQVVRLWDSFKHSGPNGNHVCMVFEPMGPNLLALIKHFNYRGIPMDMVRSITRQVRLDKAEQSS